MKPTKRLLNKIEDIFTESDYNSRCEKERLKSTFFSLKSEKIIIINKYYPVEGKINILIDTLKSISIDTSSLSERNKKLFNELTHEQLSL